MTLETFFEKFELFADAPDAVAKMRELVQYLAVTGKLVDQDDSDEPAEELIARISAMRRLGKAKEYPPVTTEETPYEVPCSWSWVRLGNVSLASDSGWSPQCHSESREGTNWGVLKVSAVSWGVFKPEENKTLPLGTEARPDCEVQPGDFLLSRANTAELVARSVVVHQTPPRLMMSDKIVRFTFPDEIEKAFINLANTSSPSRAYYARNASGTSSSMKNVGRDVMCNLPFPLPPLAEQKRIVAKVDELMALCDRLEAQQLEQETRHAALARASLARFAEAPTPANLQFLFHKSYHIPPADLRKSILTLAVQGKLVPQDPNDEPAEDTLRRCEVDMESWSVNGDNKRHAVPDSWAWVRFAGVGEQRLGKMLDAQKNRGELKPYLRNTNVQWMRFELDDVKDMRVEDREVDELRLAYGDLLICEGGEPGRCAIWRNETPEMYFQKALHRVRPCGAVMSEFLALNLQVDCGNDVLAGYFTGATIKHLTGRSLAAYPVPIPPLAEQRRIVAKVDELMALVDAMEAQLASALTVSSALLEAAVAELTTA